MRDLVSRQAAIDIERNATVDTNPSHFEAHQKFTQFMDDAEVSSFGRWQWSNGFNTALTAVGIDLKKLPSAQPEVLAHGEGELSAQTEIILCKDCKHRPTRDEDGELDFPTSRCPCQCDDFYYSWMPNAEWFCGNAERREK